MLWVWKAAIGALLDISSVPECIVTLTGHTAAAAAGDGDH